MGTGGRPHRAPRQMPRGRSHRARAA